MRHGVDTPRKPRPHSLRAHVTRGVWAMCGKNQPVPGLVGNAMHHAPLLKVVRKMLCLELSPVKLCVCVYWAKHGSYL